MKANSWFVVILVAFLVIVALLRDCGDSEGPADGTVAERDQPESRRVRHPGKDLLHPSTSTTEGTRYLRKKFEELMALKDDQDFRDYGFGRGGDNWPWIEDLKRRLDTSTFAMMERVACKELLGLALDYMGSKGAETDDTRRAREEISKVIARGEAAMKPVLPTASTAGIIPKDVEYTVIKTYITSSGTGRSLDVRLNRKVQEPVLRSIALALRSIDPKKYERTRILYYLPGMEVGAGAWASTDFDPGLEVSIFGLTVDQEEGFVNEPDSRDVVGAWLDEAPFVGGKITIYRQKKKLYMECKYLAGGSSIKEIEERTSSRGQRFQVRSGSRSGEYYVINSQGNLEIRDRDGLIGTARPTK